VLSPILPSAKIVLFVNYFYWTGTLDSAQASEYSGLKSLLLSYSTRNGDVVSWLAVTLITTEAGLIESAASASIVIQFFQKLNKIDSYG
jgi:hypothetical protein